MILRLRPPQSLIFVDEDYHEPHYEQHNHRCADEIVVALEA